MALNQDTHSLWRDLYDKGLVKDELPPSENPQVPVSISFFQFMGALLAFAGFCLIIVFFFGSLLRSATEQISIGFLLNLFAFFLSRDKKKAHFLEQLMLVISFT